MIDITMMPHPPLVYTAQDRVLVDNYMCLFGYHDFEPVMKDDTDEDKHDS